MFLRMCEMKDIEKLRDKGLDPKGPFIKGRSSIKVGFRPIDPNLIERLEALSRRLRNRGLKSPALFSLAIRSIDGFYTTRNDTTPLDTGWRDLIDVVEYDPLRDSFLTTTPGEVSELAGLFWYAFNAFPETMIISALSNRDPRPLEIPDASELRNDRMIEIIRTWKGEVSIEVDELVLWRGGMIEELEGFLIKALDEA